MNMTVSKESSKLWCQGSFALLRCFLSVWYNMVGWCSGCKATISPTLLFSRHRLCPKYCFRMDLKSWSNESLFGVIFFPVLYSAFPDKCQFYRNSDFCKFPRKLVLLTIWSHNWQALWMKILSICSMRGNAVLYAKLKHGILCPSRDRWHWVSTTYMRNDIFSSFTISIFKRFHTLNPYPRYFWDLFEYKICNIRTYRSTGWGWRYKGVLCCKRCYLSALLFLFWPFAKKDNKVYSWNEQN